MTLWILRCIFLMVAIGVSVSVMDEAREIAEIPQAPFLALVIVGAAAVIAIDAFIPRKRIELISSVYIGILVGLFLTYVLGLALTPLFVAEREGLVRIVQLLASVILCYTCISVLIQTKDDFRFIIPYVEFSKEVKGLKPYILDTSVVIDGRIADVVETGLFDTQLIMPRFVLSELQNIADSSDRMRRSRGRRGLDILNRMRSNPDIELRIFERELPEMADHPVDMQLVLLANHLDGKIITNDYNLNKVARLHNVAVINLNDIANSLKPVFLPGEHVKVKVVKAGEEAGQGVGYLDDGTMIVIESGRDHIGQQVMITVTSVLQTSAGRMIFGKYDHDA